MTDKMHVSAIGPSAAPVAAPRPAVRPRAAGPSFDAVLKERLGREPEVKFSGHAAWRLEQRAIELSDQDVVKIEQAVSTAEQKGGKEALILLNDLAFIISVRDRVVITALETAAGEARVFTHIDSVVMAK